jgi:hypothetical protein
MRRCAGTGPYDDHVTVSDRYVTPSDSRHRLLLVLMLAVGVFSMHALGHMAGGGMGMMPAAPAAVHGAARPAGHAAAPAAGSGSAAGYRRADAGPAGICLGRGGGAGLLAACVLLRRARVICRRGRVGAAPGTGGAPLGSRAGRSPPGRGWFAVARVARA